MANVTILMESVWIVPIIATETIFLENAVAPIQDSAVLQMVPVEVEDHAATMDVFKTWIQLVVVAHVTKMERAVAVASNALSNWHRMT